MIATKRVRATLESSSKKGSFDRICSRQEFWNFENWKWEMGNIFCIVCELKESETIFQPALKSYGWVVGGCTVIITSALLLLFLN